MCQGQALRDLDRAFKNFLTIPKRGFPAFKKKGRKESFYLEGSIKIIQRNYIQLPSCQPEKLCVSVGGVPTDFKPVERRR
ncbi:hypothetical protein [Okeania sp. SIO1I7]|uniref:hypothetical protein n=1 Tax=Okeania sp. SIO1I7 TaxID=2607772 RepID=UPI0013FAFF7E|nr:hypothetical protein [Okeania sp. SIO1I7]NET29867.1 hypothetical protein [Okeania sp. SIO1I7]